MATSNSKSPLATGAVSGAVSGLIVFVILVLLDHFLFRGRETRQHGLMITLVAAAIGGLIFGALIGLATVLSGSMPIGIAAGAVVFAIVKLIDAGGFSAMALIMGLIYGALFGWAVASSVVRSLAESS